MTLFAGIFNRKADDALPLAACEALRLAVSRDHQPETSVFQDNRCFLVKVDIGAFGEPGWRVDENGAASALAGEPLLSLGDEDAWQSRTDDLDLLHASWLKGDWEILRRSRGVFCAAHYQPDTGELSLIADKLGIRPLYYWADERRVVFATALRILEALDIVPKEMDVRAVTEIVGLGFALGERTPYMNVSMLRAAEVAQFSASSLSRKFYWRWEEIEPSALSEKELASEAFEQFNHAIARRTRSDTTTFAFLSGGLDSRCVVAALHERGLGLHTFNFSPSGSQDQSFGSEFAGSIGTLHTEAPRKTEGGPDWSQMLVDAWNESQARQSLPAERPLLGWSGDGGSVGLGHVHMSREIVELMREGREDEAVNSYLGQERFNIPKRFFRSDVAALLSDVLLKGCREELDAIHYAERGRAFYIFLMLNDQRRHFFSHFENIDRHKLELQLPFFDSDLLSLIISIPVDLCLAHKFYTSFLACFPPFVRAVPWQTYPGHDPCPLPAAPELSYQWSEAARAQATQRREVLRQANELLGAKDFPKRIFNKRRIRLAALLHRTGARDYGSLVQDLKIYYKYWTLCGGRFSLPVSSKTVTRQPSLPTTSFEDAGERREVVTGPDMTENCVGGAARTRMG